MGCMQSTPVNEPAAAAPVSTNSAVKSAPPSHASATAAAAATQEPETEAAPQSVPNAKFTISGVSITEVGVAFYQIESADGTVSAKRRYNDFKALYAALGNTSGLPPLPEAGLRTMFRDKHSQELLQARELQFAAILNAIAANAALAESAVFQQFLGESA